MKASKVIGIINGALLSVERAVIVVLIVIIIGELV